MTPCGDPARSVALAEAAAFELRVEEAREALREAEAAFACAPVEVGVLARFYDVEGALAVHAGDPDTADERFRAARALAPGPDPSYGSRVRDLSAAVAPASERARLEVGPIPAGAGGLLDARPAVFPLDVAVGLHLVQVGPPGEVRFGELVRVEVGATTAVETGLEATPSTGPDPVAPVPPAPRPTRALPAPRPAWLGTAGGLAVAGAVSAGLSLAARGRIAEAPDVETVEALYGRQRAFGWTAYGLLGGAAVVGGLAFR